MTNMRAILGGGLVVGSLDALFAIGYWVPRGSTPTRIFQSVAAGLLGRDAAVHGGSATAMLGVFLHYFIACGIVAVYWLAAGRLRLLREHPIVCGALYGICAWAFMQYVVIPLSAASRPARVNVPWTVSSIVAHALIIGIPAAIFAVRAWRDAPVYAESTSRLSEVE